MRFEAGGAIPVQPDFDMLRAGFAAAQATTPTAVASLHAAPAIDPSEALIRLFGGAAGADATRSALRGSFRPALFGGAGGTDAKR